MSSEMTGTKTSIAILINIGLPVHFVPYFPNTYRLFLLPLVLLYHSSRHQNSNYLFNNGKCVPALPLNIPLLECDETRTVLDSIKNSTKRLTRYLYFSGSNPCCRFIYDIKKSGLLKSALMRSGTSLHITR